MTSPRLVGRRNTTYQECSRKQTEWIADLHNKTGVGWVTHYNDVIMSAMASQITGFSIVYFTFCSGADQRKYQSSASLAFVRGSHRWPVNAPHKGPVTRKWFPFDDVIMWGKCVSYCFKALYRHLTLSPHLSLLSKQFMDIQYHVLYLLGDSHKSHRKISSKRLQMHFLEMINYHDSHEIYSCGSNWQLVSIGLDNGLAPNKLKYIIRTNGNDD